MSFFYSDKGDAERKRREAEESRRAWQADADDWDDEPGDEESDDAPTEQLLDVLNKVERHREGLRTAATYFEAILAAEPDLAAQWKAFTRAGGITAHDFRRYLDGRIMRYRPTRHRRHLRLIHNQRTPTVIGRPRRDGDAA
jgi:hypothetical protein